jgi:hypothetical protein
MSVVCNFCLLEFSNKVNLVKHQKNTIKCLKLQGKPDSIECTNCKKILAIRSYNRHKTNCDLIFLNSKNEQEKKEEKYNLVEKQNKELEKQNKELENKNKELEKDLNYYKDNNDKLRIELAESKATISILEKHNERLYVSSNNVTLKLAEKTSTVNNNTIVINTNQLTNDVLRQCANTFTIENAHNINGITKHLTSSLEDHIVCTDPSRNIFKYKNEKDEEIIDQNLEILLPQYLTAVKDRNDFLYKEVFEYFKKNNVCLSVQTDYRIFYNALNSIIEKNGQQDKYTEKCKQQMVRECKRRFLEKNKNKDKEIAKKLSVDEVIINIIETGGTLTDFINRVFPNYSDEEETDEQFNYRREMEDLFRNKKREWKNQNIQ